jgi:tetratricopeptide (TPR) repeat protein
MRICSSCQARNAGHSAFCIRCGAPLTEAHTRDVSANTDALTAVAEQAPTALVDEAAAQLADGQVSVAIANCRRAIALNPREVEAFAVLGMALEQSGELQEALDAYEVVQSLAPDRPVERQKAALLRLRLGHGGPPPHRESAGSAGPRAWLWLRETIQANPAVSAGLGAGLLVFAIGAILIVSAGRARAANELRQQYQYQVQLADQALAEQRYAEATAHYRAAWQIDSSDAAVCARWEQAYAQAQLLAEQQQRQLEIAALPKYIPNTTGRNHFAPVPIQGTAAAPGTAAAAAGTQIPVPPPTLNPNTARPVETVQGQGRTLPSTTTVIPPSRRPPNGNTIIAPVSPQTGKGAPPPPAADTTARPPKGEITIWVTQKPPPRSTPAEARASTGDAEALRARGEQLARDGQIAEAVTHLERAASAFEERARQDPASSAASNQAANSCRARIEVLRQSNR